MPSIRDASGWGSVLVGCVAWLALSTPLTAQEDTGQKVYKNTLKGTVWIWAPAGEGKFATGSGALVDLKKRIIVTNYHVVGDARRVAVMFPSYNKGELISDRRPYVTAIRGGNAIVGEVLHVNPTVDLALIQLAALPPGVKVIPLAKVPPKPAERVHSVGNPGATGALWIYTPGSVRQVYKGQIRSGSRDGSVRLEIDAWLVLTNSDTNEGDSGGPLVNDKGELLGITQGGNSQARGISIFIEVREVKAMLTKIGIKVPSTGEIAKSDKEDDEDTKKPGSGATANKQPPATPTSRFDTDNPQVSRLAHELVSARASERTELLEKYQNTRGVEYTEALAVAIPKLSGSFQASARQALSERLKRMTDRTLQNYLEDANPEIRRATVGAIFLKEAKELTKDLVPLLSDKEGDVADEAYDILCKMTGLDFGRAPDKWKRFFEK